MIRRCTNGLNNKGLGLQTTYVTHGYEPSIEQQDHPEDGEEHTKGSEAKPQLCKGQEGARVLANNLQ